MKIHLLSILSLLFLSCSEDSQEYTELPDQKIALGKKIFFDTNLSNPIGQSCATCHAPGKGFSDISNRAVSEGAVANVFGNRNAPNLSYNIFAPTQFYNAIDETYIGGLFYDGRSESLQEQLIHPFIGSAEMNNGSIHNVVLKVKNAPYFSELNNLYGSIVSDTEILHIENFKRGKGKFHTATWKETTEITDNNKEFPYILTTNRELEHYNCGTMTRRTNNALILKEDVLLINPIDAEKHLITDGDLVCISSPRGKIDVKAKLTDEVKSGVLSSTFHFPDIKMNDLTSSISDGDAMCPEYKVVSVNIRKSKGVYKG